MLSTIATLLILIPSTVELPEEPVNDTLLIVVPDRIDNVNDVVEVSPEQVEKGIALRETVTQGLCLEWVTTALDAGWHPTDLPRLMKIMWRESRCLPNACGETDSPHIRKCRDWGLMQINDYSWKRIIREMGWDIEQMHDPLENLRFARWLFEYSLERNGDGWQPWKFPAK